MQNCFNCFYFSENTEGEFLCNKNSPSTLLHNEEILIYNISSNCPEKVDWS